MPLLSGLDLLEDLLVGREAVGRLIRIDNRAFDEDFEDAARAFFQRGRDSVLRLDGGLQTGGLGEIVSLPAIQNLDVHPLLLSHDRGLMIRALSHSVKLGVTLSDPLTLILSPFEGERGG